MSKKQYDYVNEMIGICEVDTDHDEDVQPAIKRVLRKLVREAVLRVNREVNTCHRCAVSMHPTERPPTCEDCGGCDDDTCDHLYEKRKAFGHTIAKELVP